MVLYTCRKFIIKLISIDFSVLVSGLCSLLYPKEQPYSSGEEVRETSCGQLLDAWSFPDISDPGLEQSSENF